MGVSRALFLLLLGVVSAHNWLTSPARGNQNNNFNGWTSPPCPQKGERVHVQVAPGQRFPIEWASGHGYGSYTYFVVLAAQDESNMISHTLEVLDEYLAEAPTPALTYMADTWAMHSVPPPAPSTVYSSLVSSPTVTDTFWTGGRPSSFRQYSGGTVQVYNKTVSAVSGDKRAKYTNPKLPWIISVHKFALHEDTPEQMDMALMEVPTGSPGGQYVVQYLWNGYYDCVDVNVLDSSSTDIFGSPSTNVSLDRIDHCMFNMTLNNFVVQQGVYVGCMELKPGDSPAGCIKACADSNDQYNGCKAVQISPLTLPPAARFPGMYQGGTSHLPPWGQFCAKQVLTFAPDSSVCYPVKIGDNPIVGPPYKVVSDPEDPVFYSTCYRKAASGWKFKDSCPKCLPPVPKTTNKFGYTEQNSCITCRDMFTNLSPLVTPTWKTGAECFSCDGTLG